MTQQFRSTIEEMIDDSLKIANTAKGEGSVDIDQCVLMLMVSNMGNTVDICERLERLIELQEQTLRRLEPSATIDTAPGRENK